MCAAPPSRVGDAYPTGRQLQVGQGRGHIVHVDMPFDLSAAFPCVRYADLDNHLEGLGGETDLRFFLMQRRHSSILEVNAADGPVHVMPRLGCRMCDSCGPDDFLDIFGQVLMRFIVEVRGVVGDDMRLLQATFRDRQCTLSLFVFVDIIFLKVPVLSNSPEVAARRHAGVCAALDVARHNFVQNRDKSVTVPQLLDRHRNQELFRDGAIAGRAVARARYFGGLHRTIALGLGPRSRAALRRATPSGRRCRASSGGGTTSSASCSSPSCMRPTSAGS